MELEESNIDFKAPADRRPRMPEPLPVRLIAVGDVSADAVAGLEPEMDGFYVGLLELVRSTDPAALVYHADNFDLRFTVREPLFHREDLRPIAIEVLSLAATHQKLIEREIDHTRQRSIAPGQENLVLQDPSGNWVEITERKRIV